MLFESLMFGDMAYLKVYVRFIYNKYIYLPYIYCTAHTRTYNKVYIYMYIYIYKCTCIYKCTKVYFIRRFQTEMQVVAFLLRTEPVPGKTRPMTIEKEVVPLPSNMSEV